MTLDQEESLSSQLAKGILRIGMTPPSDDDRSSARQHFIDAIASAFIGCRDGTFKTLTALCPQVNEGFGYPGSGSLRVSPLDAAMLWAFAINGSVFEDGSRDGACHPAPAIMPVVLTLSADCTWEKIDQAILSGYDVMIRMARGGNPRFTAKGFHPTAVTAPFGAAAAASILLSLDFEQTQNALSLAALGSCGLMSAFKCGTTQPLQVAWAVRNGVAAALLAQSGRPGYLRIIEEGFYPTYLGGGPDPPLDFPFPLGSAIKGTYLKPYPGCRHLHPSIDAFAKIYEAHALDPEDIEKVSVGTYRIAVDTEIHDVKTRGDAYFSIPYALAARAVLGKTDYQAFGEEHLTNQRLIGVMKKVRVAVDPEVDGWYPEKRGAVVEVETAMGHRFLERVSHPLGEPENPLPRAVTFKKLRDTAAHYLPEKTISLITNRFSNGSPSEPVSSLFKVLCENNPAI